MRRSLSLSVVLLALVLSPGCSSRNGNVWQAIVEQNGQKHLLQKIAITTTAAVTTLATSTIDDSALYVPPGSSPTLALQADQDFWYEVRQAGKTTALTTYSGARPGVFVSAKQQEFVVVGADAAVLDLKADSASGTVAVFVVQ